MASQVCVRRCSFSFHRTLGPASAVAAASTWCTQSRSASRSAISGMEADSADFRHFWEDLAVPRHHAWPPPGQPLTPRPRLFGWSGFRPLQELRNGWCGGSELVTMAFLTISMRFPAWRYNPASMNEIPNTRDVVSIGYPRTALEQEHATFRSHTLPSLEAIPLRLRRFTSPPYPRRRIGVCVSWPTCPDRRCNRESAVRTG